MWRTTSVDHPRDVRRAAELRLALARRTIERLPEEAIDVHPRRLTLITEDHAVAQRRREHSRHVLRSDMNAPREERPHA